MKKYNSFQMTLLPIRKSDTGRDIYTVAVTIPNYESGDDIHFCHVNARQAFWDAMEFINDIVERMCERCTAITPWCDQTYRNAGICQSCYDKISL